MCAVCAFLLLLLRLGFDVAQLSLLFFSSFHHLCDDDVLLLLLLLQLCFDSFLRRHGNDRRRSLAHRRSCGGRRPRATLGPHNEIEWHERWARDDRRRSNGASERPSWDVGLPQLVVHSPPRPASPESVAAFSPEEHRRSSVFSPEVAVVVPRAVREARPPPDDLAVVEAGERI